MNIERLYACGIDYKKALTRFLGDASLFESVLKSFLADDTLAKTYSAFDSRDYKMLFECAHSLKGIAGNIEMTEVYKTASALTELLRKNDSPDEAAVCTAMSKLKISADDVLTGIAEALKS